MAKPKYIDNDMQGFRDKKLGGLSTFNVLDYGATGDGTTDDATAIRQTIQAAMSTDKGGIVYFPAGVYKTSRVLVPAKGIGPYDTAEGWWSDADDDQVLVFQGAGTYATTIKAGVSFTSGGIICYGSSGTNPKIAQVICRDLTLDGNYDGVDSGTIAAVGSNQPALVSIGYPHQAISGTTRSGQWHYFERCRFYRPSGFCFQALKGIHVSNCDFDQVGQPDGGASVHYDSLGGGEGDLIAVNNTWRNSKGNYVDMINANASLVNRAIFVGNVSVNHDEGGVYAAGVGSVIANNTLHNNSSGGGVGYDSGTHASARSKNVVYGNTLTNINVFSSGLSAANGDLVYGNVSLDSTSGVVETLGGVEVGGALTVAGAGTVTGALTASSTLAVTGVTTLNDILTLDSVTSDPGSPPDGSLWYRSDTHEVRARVNGASRVIYPLNYVSHQTANSATINSTTLVNGFTMTLTPGTYMFRASVAIVGNATTSDAGFALNGTAVTSAWRWSASIDHPVTIGTNSIGTVNGTTLVSAASGSFTIGTTTAVIWVELNGSFTVTTGGTVMLGASRTAGTGTFTTRNGSIYQVWRVG